MLRPWAETTESQISAKMGRTGVCCSAQGMKWGSATSFPRRHLNLKWCCFTSPCLATCPGLGQKHRKSNWLFPPASSVTIQGASVRSQPCPPGTLSLALLSSSPRCIASGAALASWAALTPFCHPVLSVTQRFSFFQKKVFHFTSLSHFRSLKMHIPPFPLSLIF